MMTRSGASARADSTMTRLVASLPVAATRPLAHCARSGQYRVVTRVAGQYREVLVRLLLDIDLRAFDNHDRAPASAQVLHDLSPDPSMAHTMQWPAKWCTARARRRCRNTPVNTPPVTYSPSADKT